MLINYSDKWRIASVLLLFIILSLGFSIRYDNIDHWYEYRTSYFTSADNLPLPLNIDAYYYLDIAQDILDGTIAKEDRQRQAPRHFQRPVTIPFLSLFLALGSKISGKPLEWIALLLPPFLAVLLAIPVYLFSVSLFSTSYLGSGEKTTAPARIAGLTSALFALVSPIYVERSSLGWCDTDILNVTLLCALTCCSMSAATARNIRKLVRWLLAFTCLTAFFIQWWDQAQTPVVFLALGYFLLAGLFSILNNRAHSKVILVFLLGISILLLDFLGKSSLHLPGTLLQYFKYIFSTDTNGTYFRFAGQLAAEQQDTTLEIMALNIAGSEWIFYLSMVGICLLILISRRYVLFLLPWLFLLTISMKSHRVMIFPVVLFGLGMGTPVFLVSNYWHDLKAKFMVPLVICIILVAWFPVSTSQAYYSKTPPFLPQLADRFKILARALPDDALIWSSWGHGHPLVYYTEASTIGDGIFHPPELVYTQYVPYAASNYRLAANWISFYSVHGLEGLRKTNELLTGSTDSWSLGMPALQDLLGKGIDESRRILRQHYSFPPQVTEEILSFLFPASSRPLYILLDYVTYNEQWFKWGRASFYPADRKFTYTMLPIYHPFQAGNFIKGKSDLGSVSIDLSKGSALIGNANILQLKQVRIDNGISPFMKRYNSSSPGAPPFTTLLLNQNRDLTHGALIDDRVLNTLFTRMLFLLEYDTNYFIPVIKDSPMLMVYQVRGDTYRGPNE